VPRLSINLAPLIGVTPDSPTVRAYLNIGWEF